MALPIFGKYMEKIYQDGRLSYDYGAFPKPSRKITKKYNCVSGGEGGGSRRRAVAIDTVAADDMLEQLNNGGGAAPVGDSTGGR